MEVPPPIVFRQGRERLHQSIKALKPGQVTLRDESVSAAVSMDDEGFELIENLGPTQRQQVEVSICKTAITFSPEVGDPLVVSGRAFRVSSVLGHDSVETEWRLVGTRTPGGDDE